MWFIGDWPEVVPGPLNEVVTLLVGLLASPVGLLGLIVGVLSLLIGILGLFVGVNGIIVTVFCSCADSMRTCDETCPRGGQRRLSLVRCGYFETLLLRLRNSCRAKTEFTGRLAILRSRKIVGALCEWCGLSAWQRRRRDRKMARKLGLPPGVGCSWLEYRLGRAMSCLSVFGKICPALSLAWRRRRRDRALLATVTVPLGVVPSIAVYWQREMRRL